MGGESSVSGVSISFSRARELAISLFISICCFALLVVDGKFIPVIGPNAEGFATALLC